MKTLRILILSLALLIASSVAFSPSESFADLVQVFVSKLGNPTAWIVDGTGQLIGQTATNNNILTAADTDRLLFYGGSVLSNSNGASLELDGNTFSGNNGNIYLTTSAATSANVNISTASASGQINLNTTAVGTTRWSVLNAGDLSENATNGGNVVFNRALKGMVSDFATLAGAGSTQSDAAAVAHVVSRVTGANGTVGVHLPGISTVTAGQMFYIINSNTTSALKYYSNAAGELIDGQSGTTANSLGAKLWATCFVFDSSNWYCADTVIPF